EAGDQRAGPETEQGELDDLVHGLPVSPALSVLSSCRFVWLRGHPSLGRRNPVADLLEDTLAEVAVKLGVVVADTRVLRVLAAVNRRRAEHHRPPERPHLLDDPGRGDL